MPAPAAKTDFRMWIAAAGALLVESASNALYAFSLGGIYFVTFAGVVAPLDGMLLAVGAISLAVFQAQLADRVVHVNRADRRWLPWLCALFMLAVCMTYSMGAMSAHVLKLQRHIEDARRGDNKDFYLAKDALADAENRRDRLLLEMDRVRDARTIEAIKSELGNVTVEKWRFDRTAECTQPVKASDVSACAPFQALRVELAQAIEKQAFASDLAAAETDVASKRSAMSRIAAPAEPSAVEKALGNFLAWALAVTIELAATFGFALAKGARGPAVPPARNASPDAPAPSGPAPGARRRNVQSSDVFLMYQRIRDGLAAVPGATVHADGWIEAPQQAIAAALGTSKTSVNSRLKELEAAKQIEKRKDGSKTLLRLAYSGPIAAAAP